MDRDVGEVHETSFLNSKKQRVLGPVARKRMTANPGFVSTLFYVFGFVLVKVLLKIDSYLSASNINGK